jgi:hypothetical protein
MKKLFFFLLALALVIWFGKNTHAQQIFEPEGLNMPGDWDAWTNPPDNPVLANPNQNTGGLLIKKNNTGPRWTTSFEVSEADGDLTAGTYAWLFTSGPNTNYFQNKWSSVEVVADLLQTYTKEGPDDNSITLENGFWYTMVWEDIGYVDCRAIFMKTSEEPVDILTVSEPSNVNSNELVTIDFTLSDTPSAEENFYLQYTTDGWASTTISNAVLTGTSGSADIPGQDESSVVEYNIFSSSVSNITSDGFLYALRINDKNELNYTYTVGTALPDTIGWCNLQWPPEGEIEPEQEFIVYGQAFIYNLTEQTDPVTGLQAWVGWNETDTDPSTWTNWIVAPYFGNVNDADEFAVDLGAQFADVGTYYYATRFQYLDQEYKYGGYSENNPEVGDFWDGTDFVNGLLTITNEPTPSEITYANLQWPPDGEIEPENEFLVYGQVYIEGVTTEDEPNVDIQSWIGWSSSNSDPASWTNWIPANFGSNEGNNDEYLGNLDAEMDTEGTFYYATRFKYLDQDFVYGGYSESGGGFWNGTDNVSGVLTVNTDPSPPEIAYANLQWPPDGEIEPGNEFLVFGQVYIEGITTEDEPNEDIQSWIGWNTSNSDPAGWTNWITADFGSNQGNNDEYVGNLGAEMNTEGAFYYATRFKYLDQDFVYGGYSESGGGFWNGTENVSGVLIVNADPTPPEITYANLQWPPDGEIEPGNEFLVYGQVYIEGITTEDEPNEDIQSWIGWSTSNSDPAGWTNWIIADFGSNQGNNDEYVGNLGAEMNTEGAFYYATRFKYLDQDFVYGGYSESGGGFWDGINFVNGELNVEEGLVAYPVLFTITDATGLYSNIKFSGDMTNWIPIDMEQSGNEWTLSLELYPGSYEWGVLEDDGSANGIWLVIGDNLEVTVDDQGNISGDVSYTVTFVGIEESDIKLEIYPNPTSEKLYINIPFALEAKLINSRGRIVKEFSLQ